MDRNIDDKELDRELRNLNIPIEEQHIPLEDDEYFHKIYGKAYWEQRKAKWAKKGKNNSTQK